MSTPTSDRAMTWAALLGQWTDFARASLALPKDASGERWRSAVPAIIRAQAIAHALGELARLPDDAERALAVDRAELGIRQSSSELNAIWRGEQMPTELERLIADARTALDAARGGGLEWRVLAESMVCSHPGELVEALIESGFAGDLWLPVPGAALFKGSPCGFLRGPRGTPPDASHARAVGQFLGDRQAAGPTRTERMRQVYRQFDFGRGRAVRDLVVPFESVLPPGQAQLVAVIERGEPRSVTLPIRGMSEQDPLPVEFED